MAYEIHVLYSSQLRFDGLGIAASPRSCEAVEVTFADIYRGVARIYLSEFSASCAQEQRRSYLGILKVLQWITTLTR